MDPGPMSDQPDIASSANTSVETLPAPTPDQETSEAHHTDSNVTANPSTTASPTKKSKKKRERKKKSSHSSSNSTTTPIPSNNTTATQDVPTTTTSQPTDNNTSGSGPVPLTHREPSTNPNSEHTNTNNSSLHNNTNNSGNYSTPNNNTTSRKITFSILWSVDSIDTISIWYDFHFLYFIPPIAISVLQARNLVSYKGESNPLHSSVRVQFLNDPPFDVSIE